MTFQEFIRSKGITQTQLADAMKLNHSNISGWGTGEYFPRPASIEKIVEGFATLGIEVTYEEVFRSLLYTKREKATKEK